MTKKTVLVTLMLLVVMVCLTGCMARITENHDERPPSGFFRGIWHGWIAPISLVLQFVDRDYRMFDPYNNGFAYEIGFYMAVISGFGTIALVRRKKS